MLQRKVQIGEALSRNEQQQIKRAYLTSRTARFRGVRILMLMTLAIAGVMGVSQGVLAITGM